MARFLLNRLKSKGQVPGSLIFTGDRKMKEPVIRLISYNDENVTDKLLSDIDEIDPLLNDKTIKWVQITGLHDIELVNRIGEKFKLHALTLEDLLDTGQRPKMEEDNDYLHYILKHLTLDEGKTKLNAEQISIIQGKDIVLTLQESSSDIFDPIYERIIIKKGRIRSRDAGYLVYALLDILVETYIETLEIIGEQAEHLGNRLLLKSDKNSINTIYNIKIELNFFRKSVRPLLDIMAQILKSDLYNVHKSNLKFYKDLNDLVMQINDGLEIYNNLISDYINLYSTNMGMRMNEIMKTLTVFAALFIPLTFLAGVYGMNFKYFPELGFKYSYPIFWGVVLLVITGLILFFRRKKWL